MRMSELSRRSGVPLATIKFYLRQGLLPAGHRTARNQATYDERHLRRLRLIRALLEVGRLTLADVRRVVGAVEDESIPIHRAIGIAHRELDARAVGRPAGEELAKALADVDGLLRRRRWQVAADAPARRALAAALVALRRLGQPGSVEGLKRYADVADQLARAELEATPDGTERSETVEFAVVGTVVYEAVLVALRKLAQEHHSRRRFGDGTEHSAD